MKKNRFWLVWVFFLSLPFILLPSISLAATSPLSLNIIPPVQFPPEDFNVVGLRVSLLWGSHRNMYGLDLSMVGNITTQNFVGIGLSGVFNATHGQTTMIGFQAAGVTNINTNKLRVYGIQVAPFNYNKGEASVVGLQLGVINHSKHTNIYGFQVGVYNRAQVVNGFQLGLVNMTESLHGLQIGLINFHNRGTVSVAPILNIGF